MKKLSILSILVAVSLGLYFFVSGGASQSVESDRIVNSIGLWKLHGRVVDIDYDSEGRLVLVEHVGIGAIVPKWDAYGNRRRVTYFDRPLKDGEWAVYVEMDKGMWLRDKISHNVVWIINGSLRHSSLEGVPEIPVAFK